MQTIQRDCVAAIIESGDGKILLGKKDPNGGGVYADCWQLPGGDIQAGESHLEALRREVKEKVGIEISGFQADFLDGSGYGEAMRKDPRTGEHTNYQMRFNIYKVHVPVNAAAIPVVLESDLVQAVWVSYAELANYWLTPPSMALFTKLGYL